MIHNILMLGNFVSVCNFTSEYSMRWIIPISIYFTQRCLHVCLALDILHSHFPIIFVNTYFQAQEAPKHMSELKGSIIQGCKLATSNLSSTRALFTNWLFQTLFRPRTKGLRFDSLSSPHSQEWKIKEFEVNGPKH